MTASMTIDKQLIFLLGVSKGVVRLFIYLEEGCYLLEVLISTLKNVQKSPYTKPLASYVKAVNRITTKKL